ncbi:hypothetical protein Q4592_17400 [Agarivorans sp. 1_MG-2023]|nr:hypothetical protein [Agarivorans sp. 1_MG-2023]
MVKHPNEPLIRNKPKYNATIKQKILFSFATLTVVGGVILLGIAGKYYLSYLIDTDANPVRHEHLIGVVLSVMFSVPFWVAASGLIYPLRTLLPRLLYMLINVMTGVIVGAFLFVNIAPLFIALFEK